VIPDSIRFVCPSCFKEHKWTDAEKMNLKGRFVHKNPSCLARRGFQVGGLGIYYNQDKTWYNIACKFEHAGKNSPREKRQEF
jgi:hypothetical protein